MSPGICFFSGAYFTLFSYISMIGITITFQSFKIAIRIFGSERIDLTNLINLFTGEVFPLDIRNSFTLAFMI